MIEEEHVGEEEGGLGFAEVELDSTLIGDLGVKYMVGNIGRGWRLWIDADWLCADHLDAYVTGFQQTGSAIRYPAYETRRDEEQRTIEGVAVE